MIKSRDIPQNHIAQMTAGERLKWAIARREAARRATATPLTLATLFQTSAPSPKVDADDNDRDQID